MPIKKEPIKYSLNNLMHRKVRSAYTIISILIGITTIFVFVSFGLGLYNYIAELSSGSAADKIVIQAKGTDAFGLDTTFKLTDKDLDAIKKTSGVYKATGVYFKAAEVIQEKKRIYTIIIAYDPEEPLIMDISDLKIEKGRELAGSEKNIVLGYNFLVPDKIFPRAYSVGEKIEVQGQDIKIVGFYSPVGNPADDAQIYVTNDFMKEIYPDENLSYNWIAAQVDASNLANVVDNVEKNLRQERNLDEGKEDFFVQSFEDMIQTYRTILDVVIGFVILIALISILVSAINTANTMITSVLERVKEIGIMKSIGAKNSEIFTIFLFESSFLGFVAGTLGVLLGVMLTSLGKAILDSLGYSFLSPYYSIPLFLGCILFAILTGAISGIIPAINATRISPAQALRYE